MLKESDYVQVRTAVPVDGASMVRKAMGDAGAGQQGNYSHCSGSYSSTGRFTPLEGANPTIGEVGKPEEVKEEIIEVLCHKDKVEQVIKAMIEAHPYEHPPLDIFPRLEIA